MLYDNSISNLKEEKEFIINNYDEVYNSMEMFEIESKYNSLEVIDIFFEFFCGLFKNFEKYFKPVKNTSIVVGVGVGGGGDTNSGTVKFIKENFLKDFSSVKDTSFLYRFTETSVFSMLIEDSLTNNNILKFFFEKIKKKNKGYVLVPTEPTINKVIENIENTIKMDKNSKTYDYKVFPRFDVNNFIINITNTNNSMPNRIYYSPRFIFHKEDWCYIFYNNSNSTNNNTSNTSNNSKLWAKFLIYSIYEIWINLCLVYINTYIASSSSTSNASNIIIDQINIILNFIYFIIVDLRDKKKINCSKNLISKIIKTLGKLSLTYNIDYSNKAKEFIKLIPNSSTSIQNSMYHALFNSISREKTMIVGNNKNTTTTTNNNNNNFKINTNTNDLINPFNRKISDFIDSSSINKFNNNTDNTSIHPSKIASSMKLTHLNIENTKESKDTGTTTTNNNKTNSTNKTIQNLNKTPNNTNNPNPSPLHKITLNDLLEKSCFICYEYCSHCYSSKNKKILPLTYEEILSSFKPEKNCYYAVCHVCKTQIYPNLYILHKTQAKADSIDLVKFISPLILIKELENIFRNYNEIYLFESEYYIHKDHRHIFWNMVFYFNMMGLPLFVLDKNRIDNNNINIFATINSELQNTEDIIFDKKSYSSSSNNNSYNNNKLKFFTFNGKQNDLESLRNISFDGNGNIDDVNDSLNNSTISYNSTLKDWEQILNYSVSEKINNNTKTNVVPTEKLGFDKNDYYTIISEVKHLLAKSSKEFYYVNDYKLMELFKKYEETFEIETIKEKIVSGVICLFIYYVY